MPLGARASLRPIAILVLCGALLGACGAADGDTIRTALEVVPASAVERSVFVSVGEPGAGFGTALPAGALSQLLGMAPEQVRAVAETGGEPFTAIVGDVEADRAVEAAQGQGYAAQEISGWWALRPAGQAPSQLAAAIPALAVRDGVAILGSAAEVAAVVDGAADAASLGWVSRLLEVLDEDDRAVAFGQPGRILDAIEASDDVVPPPPPDAPHLRPYDGYALTWRDQMQGRILLARPPGGVSSDDAAALAVRTSTGVLLGGRRHAADVVTGGGPRIDAEEGLVRMPVEWAVSPAELRPDVEQGRLAFLAPR